MSDHSPERKTNRLRDYNYSLPGYYFITICTKNKICYFGDIENGKMYSNEIGQIVEKYWHEIDNHYDTTTIGEYSIMPNRLHGIIVIDDFTEKKRHSVNRISNEKKNGRHALLSTIIRTFKTLTRREFCLFDIGSKFEWQRSFYDHIIRNENSLVKIREYIKNNPPKWHLDKYYK